MYMLDTNILINFLRGSSSHLYEMLRKSDASIIKVPAIVKAELLLGAAKSKNPREERFKVESILLPFEIVPFDESCALQYGQIRAYLERKGKPIGANDYLIAATALAHSAVLVTDNIREFMRVPNLPVEDWCEVEL